MFEAAFDDIDTDGDHSASFEELVQFALKSGQGGDTVLLTDADMMGADEDLAEWEKSDETDVLKINGETVDDKWDALRRQEGALPDHDPMCKFSVRGSTTWLSGLRRILTHLCRFYNASPTRLTHPPIAYPPPS